MNEDRNHGSHPESTNSGHEQHHEHAGYEGAAVMGGAGSAVAEWLAAEGIPTPVLQLGLPDSYLEHMERGDMLASVGLDAEGIAASIRRRRPAMDSASIRSASA